MGKAKAFSAESRNFFGHDVMRFETLDPEARRVWRNCRRGRVDLTCPPGAASRPRPGKKSQDRAWRAAMIAEVKMIPARVIEVHRSLNKSQAEQTDVEIKIAMGI